MLSVAVVHPGGHYPVRVLEYLQTRSGARVTSLPVPANLPLDLDEDEAAAMLPPEVAAAEVVIALDLHPGLLAELPYAMGKGAGQALLAPREDPGWVRPGLMNQVTRGCARFGIENAFPKPFCALEPRTPIITQFAEEYGVGRHRLQVRCEDGLIAAAECLTGSACGLTEWVAQQLVGQPCDDTLARTAVELLHFRPCLATMVLDAETGDTVMHRAIAIMEAAGREALDALEVRQ
jgi:thymidylate synthase